MRRMHTKATHRRSYRMSGEKRVDNSRLRRPQSILRLSRAELR